MSDPKRTTIKGYAAIISDAFDDSAISDVHVGQSDVVLAGRDERAPYAQRKGEHLRRSAVRKFTGVVLGTQRDASAAIRIALDEAASATYWLEGTDLLEPAHKDLHRIGRYAVQNFPEGCTLHQTDDGQYEQTCPVALAHKRFGFSAGMIVHRRTCSLCGGDVADCDHLPGYLYRVRGGVADSPTGHCRVCGSDTCTHDPAITYLAAPMSVIKEVAAIEEVSIVPNPHMPDARLTAIPISQGQLREALGSGFTPGDQVSCSQCLAPCPGFQYLPE